MESEDPELAGVGNVTEVAGCGTYCDGLAVEDKLSVGGCVCCATFIADYDHEYIITIIKNIYFYTLFCYFEYHEERVYDMLRLKMNTVPIYWKRNILLNCGSKKK